MEGESGRRAPLEVPGGVLQGWTRCCAVLPAPRSGQGLLFICLHPKSKRDREWWDGAEWFPCRRHGAVGALGHHPCKCPHPGTNKPNGSRRDGRENTNKTKISKYLAFPRRISHACLVSGHPKKPTSHPQPFSFPR